jgi:hypothetical protein
MSWIQVRIFLRGDDLRPAEIVGVGWKVNEEV